MRLTHYLPTIRIAIGGTVRATLDMCETLAAFGHEITLVSADDTDVPEAWKRGDGPVRSVGLGKARKHIGFFDEEQVKRARDAFLWADVGHIHAMWVPSSAHIGRICKDAGVPYVFTPHGALDDWPMAQKTLKKQIYLKLLGQRLIDNAAAVHAATQGEQRQTSRRVRKPPVLMAPLIFDLTDFQTLPDPDLARRTFDLPEDGPPIVLFLSRLHGVKRCSLLLHASRLLTQRGVEHRLVIAGSADKGDPGEEARMHALASKLGVNARFLGAVYDKTKLSLFQTADVYVMPSAHENFCFALMEAMACGVPAVTVPDVTSSPDVERSGAAITVQPTPEGLADGIASMLREPPARKAEMRKQARDFILDWLSPRHIIDQYEAIYSTVLAQAGKAPSGKSSPSLSSP